VVNDQIDCLSIAVLTVLVIVVLFGPRDLSEEPVVRPLTSLFYGLNKNRVLFTGELQFTGFQRIPHHTTTIP
jgi:hypothetical protein